MSVGNRLLNGAIWLITSEHVQARSPIDVTIAVNLLLDAEI